MTDSDGNSSADMLEKSSSDWIRRGKPARKNMYYHYSAFVSSRRDLLQAWSQMAVASTLSANFRLLKERKKRIEW